MTRTILAALIALVALSASVPRPALAQASPEAIARLGLAGPAKRYCSGIWVSGRDPEEALRNSVLLGRQLVEAYETGALTLAVDDERRIVSATRGGVTARARHFGDQGCAILRPETDQPLFTPRRVVSSLPPAASSPWPMGDLLPDSPLPADVDGPLLDEAARILFANELDRRAAFVVVHRGRIVKEQYGSGAHARMQLESWSMGKSMTATLIGRLIQMGRLGLWEQAPVPEWQNSQGDPRAAIRVADLLRMSSGLRFSGGGSTPEQMAASYIAGEADHGLGYSAPIDVFQLSTSRDAEHPPNTVGRYRNSDPWTLGSILRRVVENELGEEYLTWPQRALFDKIGIRRFVAETDIYGNFILTGYNYGTARDWARLGLLYLQRGAWNGERLLSEEFVDFVRTPAPAWDEPVYGGLFWLNTADESGRGRRIPTLPRDTYNAAGAGDQSTYVIPSRDLVIVVMSHRAGAELAPDRTQREREALGLAVKAVDPSWTWD
jgi:CubicO group peptidase (beta-lactamase class C family)